MYYTKVSDKKLEKFCLHFICLYIYSFINQDSNQWQSKLLYKVPLSFDIENIPNVSESNINLGQINTNNNVVQISDVNVVDFPSQKNRDYWFFKNSAIFNTSQSDTHQLPLFPGEDPLSDRLVNQLLYHPQNYDPDTVSRQRYKTIYLADGINSIHQTDYGE